MAEFVDNAGQACMFREHPLVRVGFEFMRKVDVMSAPRAGCQLLSRLMEWRAKPLLREATMLHAQPTHTNAFSQQCMSSQ